MEYSAVEGEAEDDAATTETEAIAPPETEESEIAVERTPMGERRSSEGVTESDEVDYTPPDPKLVLEQGKPDKAAEYLQQVVSTGVSPEFRNIARLRLARVLTFQEKYDEALKALTDPGSRAFAPAFHDVRGDVYYAMGKSAEARSEYEQALNGDASATVIDRAYVQAKLDDLGGASAALTAAPTIPTPITPMTGPAAPAP